jgi:drug/metabolite transporter (DMT)-like permease
MAFDNVDEPNADQAGRQTRRSKSPSLWLSLGPSVVALACIVLLLLFDDNRSAPWWAYILLLASALAWGARALLERRRATRENR